jgi:hypothetical protein
MNRSSNDRRSGKRGRLLGRLLRLHRCQRGQAIYVVVIFAFLMAGLVFLVLNSGEKLNHKVQMQSTADAVTATGAAWYGRGLNTVSMCNVAETQLLSMINLLDTLKTVTPPAVKCIDEFVQNIGSSHAGHDIQNDERLRVWLVVGNASQEQIILHQFDEIVQAVNWPDYLDYDSGILWQCIYLMDGFSQAVVADTPLAAQREAMDIAQKNHAEFGFVLPLWPALPVTRGTFEDFLWPMVYGSMPPENRNHDSRGDPIGGFYPVMGYYGHRSTFVREDWSTGRVLGRVGGRMGPWTYWREPITDPSPMGLFDISRFSLLFNVVSSSKLWMMFGSADDRVSLERWEMDYDAAKQLAQQRPQPIRRTWWESTGFNARYPGNEEMAPFPLPPSGQWAALKDEEFPDVNTQAYRGWADVEGRQQVPPGYVRATESWEGADPRGAVFYKVDRRRTANYPELGIIAPHPPVHPDGSPWPYTDAEMKTFYHVSLWRFNAAELEDDTSLPPYQQPAVAPYLWTPDGTNLMTNVDNRFTFVGFAYRSGKVRNWAARFTNPNPIEDLVCYAQARVYNRWSWDTFTQHWKVKLTRLGMVDPSMNAGDRWQQLDAAMGAGLPAAGSDLAGQLTPERIEPVRKMVTAYSPDLVREVTH